MAASAEAIAVPLGGTSAGESDRGLVLLSQAGSKDAFEELVRRHQRRVFGLVSGILRRREDVEDVAQQVFLKAYVAIRKFDQRAAFSTWLYKITVNECWDYLRKKKIRPLVYEADLPEDQVPQLDGILSSAQPPANPAEQAEARELAERLLMELPEQDRQLLTLKEIEGFSVQELAEMMGLNVNTVKVRLFRARGRIVNAYRQGRSAGNSAAPNLERPEKE